LPSLFRFLCAGTLAILVASCSSPETGEAAAPRLLVRMAQESGRDHPVALATRELSRLAEKASGGRIRIRVYEDGYLGDETEVVEQLRFGGIDMAVVSVRALESLSKTAAALGKGGRFATGSAMDEALAGEAGIKLAEELEAGRLLLLSWYDGGSECYLLPRSPAANSIRALRIGVERSNSVIDDVTAAGAIPVPLSTLELRRTLEAGMVDGVRAPLAFVLSNRLDADYRVSPIPGSRIPMLVIGSRVSLMKMPGNDRAILSEAVKASRIFLKDALTFMEARFARDYPHPWALNIGEDR
jgi:TRAP-type C4-dicarboxylate transport system substrate-binding protein